MNKLQENNYHKHSYIIVRNDLPDIQKLVQSSHVAWECGKEYSHPSLVVVVVKNEKKLKLVMQDLTNLKIKYKLFRDNIFNNEITAIGTEPLDDIQYLKRFQLLKI